MERIKRVIGLWKAAFKKWTRDNATVSAAAIAFFSGLSLAPLLLFGVILAGILLQGAEVRQTLLRQAQSLLGTTGRQTVETILESASAAPAGRGTSLLSFGALLWSASGLFNQFQTSLNRMWRVPDEHTYGLLATAISRGRALLMVLIAGGLLMLTALISVAVSGARNMVFQLALLLDRSVPVIQLGTWTRIVTFGLPLLDLLLSFVLLTLLFGWLFSAVPRTGIRWRDVRGGAIWAALLFIVGKWGLAWYLGSGIVGSAYGAAGALLLVLLWVYYSAQILLLGVAYSYVDTYAYGSRRAADALEILPEQFNLPGTLPADTDLPRATAVDEPTPPATSDTARIHWAFAAVLFFVGLFVGARDTRRR